MAAEIELLQDRPRVNDSSARVDDGPAEIRRFMAEIERVHAQLDAKLSESDTGVDGTIPSVLSPANLGEEAPYCPAAGHTITDVLPFVDDRAAHMDIAVASAGVASGGAHERSLEFLQRRMGLADFVHDGARRDAMVDEMRKGGLSYSAEEVALIAEATELLSGLATGVGKARPISSHAKTVEVAQTKYDKRSGMVLGEVKLLVPASPEQIIAFLMQIDSKFYQSKFNPKVDVRCEILEVKNLHCTVVFSEVKTAPFDNRTFLNATLWQKISDVSNSNVARAQTPLTYVRLGGGAHRAPRQDPCRARGARGPGRGQESRAAHGHSGRSDEGRIRVFAGSEGPCAEMVHE
jgi:hypothetical protein